MDDNAQRSLPLPDLLHLVDLLAPECIEVTPDALRIGQEYACGVAVTACPREVSFDGWLAPLLLHDEVMDISFHYHPQDTAAMKRQLARNRAGHASGRRFNRREGRADDPDALVAEEDINRLLDDLAHLKERVFDLGFYLLLRASSREALTARLERLYSVLGLLSLDAAAHPATFEQVEVLQSCLPQARDELLRTFTLDSTTLATMFPFLSNSLMMPGGVLVGVSETHEPVLLNPWDASLENPHLFIGGVTGSGKSYLGKLLVERDLLLNWQRGDQCFVIDPDLEYQQLAEALEGTVVRLAPGSAQRLNPFDLLPSRCDFRTYLVEASKGDRLAEKIQDLHAMLDIILAEDVSPSSSGGGMLTKREKGLLDRALLRNLSSGGHQRGSAHTSPSAAALASALRTPEERPLWARRDRPLRAAVPLRLRQPVQPVLRLHLDRSREQPRRVGHSRYAQRTASSGHFAHRRPCLDTGALRQPEATRALHRRGGLADRASRRRALPGDALAACAQTLPAPGDHDAESRTVRAGSLGQRRGLQRGHQSAQNTGCDQRSGGSRALPFDPQRTTAPHHLWQARGAGTGRRKACDHHHPGQRTRACADHHQSGGTRRIHQQFEQSSYRPVDAYTQASEESHDAPSPRRRLLCISSRSNRAIRIP